MSKKYVLFHTQRGFSTQSQLLNCCLTHITIIILKRIFYLVYLGPCLGLGLFISYLRDQFLIISPIFIAINHIMLLKQTYLFFVHF